jgi:hypothetical protein
VGLQRDIHNDVERIARSAPIDRIARPDSTPRDVARRRRPGVSSSAPITRIFDSTASAELS